MTIPNLTKIMLRIAAIYTVLLQSPAAYSQVVGCKDPAASNYNPSATIADSSCIYNNTFYTPPIRVNPINNLLVETSGLQWADNSLWTFNDGGGAAAVYRIDTASDAILQTVNLGGAANEDWEAIAFDGTYFFIGDFGNNANGARTDLKIYKFPISAIPAYSTDPVTTISSALIEVINFTYSDQLPIVATTNANTTRWDCEAMVIDGGKIHLFSKNWVDVTTTHYLINSTAAGTYSATPEETFITDYLVTDATKVPGLNIIALLGYQNGFPGNHYLHLLSDFSAGLFFNGNRRRINLPNAGTMAQAEGITFRTSSYGYISNEKITDFITIDQKLRSFNTGSFVPLYVLPLALTSFNVVTVNGAHQVKWGFALPVQNLKVLGSSNGIDFTELKTYPTSTTGSFVNQLPALVTCYKLSWQKTNGSVETSTTICLGREEKAGFTNMVLSRHGELNFKWNGRQPGTFLFKLLTTDGKLLTETTQKVVITGYNTIRFSKNLNSNNLILLQVIGGEEQKAILLKVQK